MKNELIITEEMKREYFTYDVKMGSHPRYGKNASWDNYKNPDHHTLKRNDPMGPKIYWYAYEMGSGKIAIKYSLEKGVFGPKVFCYLDVPGGQTFEETIFQYWSK